MRSHVGAGAPLPLQRAYVAWPEHTCWPIEPHALHHDVRQHGLATTSAFHPELTLQVTEGPPAALFGGSASSPARSMPS